MVSCMEVEVSSPIEEILVRNGRAYGVRLDNGEEIRAKLVASNLNAKITFGKIVREEHLPEKFLHRIRNYRAKGSSFKLLRAVERLPQYAGFSKEKTGVDYAAYAHIGPTPEYLERAFGRRQNMAVTPSSPFCRPSCLPITIPAWRRKVSTSCPSTAGSRHTN